MARLTRLRAWLLMLVATFTWPTQATVLSRRSTLLMDSLQVTLEIVFIVQQASHLTVMATFMWLMQAIIMFRNCCQMVLFLRALVRAALAPASSTTPQAAPWMPLETFMLLTSITTAFRSCHPMERFWQAMAQATAMARLALGLASFTLPTDLLSMETVICTLQTLATIGSRNSARVGPGLRLGAQTMAAAAQAAVLASLIIQLTSPLIQLAFCTLSTPTTTGWWS